MELETKSCTLCNKICPHSAFNKNKKYEDGLEKFCRECSKKKQKKRGADSMKNKTTHVCPKCEILYDVPAGFFPGDLSRCRKCKTNQTQQHTAKKAFMDSVSLHEAVKIPMSRTMEEIDLMNESIPRCETCQQTFKNFPFLVRHLCNVCHGDDVLKTCLICQSTFDCLGALYDHLLEKHPDNPLDPPEYGKGAMERFFCKPHARHHKYVVQKAYHNRPEVKEKANLQKRTRHETARQDATAVQLGSKSSEDAAISLKYLSSKLVTGRKYDSSEKGKQTRKEWKKSNPEKRHEYSLRHEAKPERILYKKNLEKTAALIVTRKTWKVNNREKMRKCYKLSHKKHREKRRVESLAYKQIHPQNQHDGKQIEIAYRYLVGRCRSKGTVCDLREDQAMKILCMPCAYCGVTSEDSVIGIDRIDSDLGYVMDNVLPCCDQCNDFKKDFQMSVRKVFLIDKEVESNGLLEAAAEVHNNMKCSLSISTFCGTSNFSNSMDISMENPSSRLKAYVGHAARLDVPFNLDQETFSAMMLLPCYYCGESSEDGVGIGIDRVHDEAGYVEENIVSACKFCNFAKGTARVEEFLEHVCDIARHCEETAMPTPLNMSAFDHMEEFQEGYVDSSGDEAITKVKRQKLGESIKDYYPVGTHVLVCKYGYKYHSKPCGKFRNDNSKFWSVPLEKVLGSQYDACDDCIPQNIEKCEKVAMDIVNLPGVQTNWEILFYDTRSDIVNSKLAL